MGGEKYSNREIDRMIEGINEKLDLILVQTTKTNGSVRDLQLWKANFEGKTYMVPIVVSALIAGGIGLLFKLF